MFLLVVYNDFDRSSICSLIKFRYISDIIRWTGGALKYPDARKFDRKYKTYKCLFSIIRLSQSNLLLETA